MTYQSKLSDMQGADKHVYVYLNPKIAKHYYKSVSAGQNDFEGEGFAIYGILEEVLDSGILLNRIFKPDHVEFYKTLEAVKKGEISRDVLFDDYLESTFIPWSSIVAIV